MGPLIEIKGVSKCFKQRESSTDVLSHLHLSIHKGDIFGIIGLSGAGKSTLIRCICRLEKPNEGQILVHGQDITQIEGKQLRAFRQNIGMVFQDFHLLSGCTVGENIAYPLEVSKLPKKERKKRVRELLKLIKLETKEDMYPAHLSGGEQQRVGIARALANNPEILLCDEATSSLDPRTTKEILALLRRVHQELGVTIILITHEMEVVKHICNKVAVLDKGQIVEEGTILEIFIHPKHPVTRNFLQQTTHLPPPHFLKEQSSSRKLLRLCFIDAKADEPIISRTVKTCDIEINILLGWIDAVQKHRVGSLIIEAIGTEQNIVRALDYFKESGVLCEEVEYEPG